jgi:uncharacterized membrane protein
LSDDEAPGPDAGAIHLHPRAVPVRHALAWYEEAMRLWKRSPARWGALAVATLATYALLSRLPGSGSLLGKLFTPLVGAGMVVASFAADRGEPVRLVHAVSAFAAPAGAIAAIVLTNVIMLLGEAVTAWWIADVNVLVQEGEYDTLSIADSVGIYIVDVLMSLPFTFIPYHVLLERADPVAAFSASFRAFSLNALPLMIYGAVSIVLVAFAALTLGLGFLVALPLWVAASYAAWKDIFGVRVGASAPAA